MPKTKEGVKQKEGSVSVTFSRKFEMSFKDPIFRRVVYMIEHGFHRQVIADQTGVTPYRISKISKAIGTRLRDYRDGKTEAAERIILKAPHARIRK